MFALSFAIPNCHKIFTPKIHLIKMTAAPRCSDPNRTITETIRLTFLLFSHVIVPATIAKLVPRGHLLSETEWRNLGIQQSPGKSTRNSSPLP